MRFFLPLIVLLTFGSVFAQTGWFDSDWKQRQVIRITNDTDSGLANYQTKIVVQYHPEMQPDFDDVRFTDVNGVYLNYYLESFVSSSSAIFWVKVPSIPARGESTIHLYFDNDAANTSSRGEGVFDFFDDFSSGSLEEWVTNGAGMSTGAGLLFVYTTIDHLVYTRNFVTTNGVIEARIKSTGNYNNVNVAARINAATKNSLAAGNAGLFGKLYLFQHLPAFNSLGFTSFDQNVGFITFGLRLHQTTAQAQVGAANEPFPPQVEGVTDAPRSGAVGLDLYRSSAEIDWFRVRQYAPAEPMVEPGVVQLYDSVVNHPRYEKLSCLWTTDITSIKADPSKTLQVFEKCKAELAFKLGLNVSEAELYAAFCTIVAYRVAPYGGSIATGLTELLHEPDLDCDNYALLTGYLNELYCDPAPLYFVGVDHGAVGNHAQLFVNNRLLLDPTIGLVALISREQVFGGQSSKKIVLFTVRPYEIVTFRQGVIDAVSNGSYKQSDIIYTYDSFQSFLAAY